ncbi:MAG: IS6 family transposase, partial [Phyllobacterium sp.]
FSALRNLFVPPSTKHSAIAIRIHRIRAMAEWNAVTGMLA